MYRSYSMNDMPQPVSRTSEIPKAIPLPEPVQQKKEPTRPSIKTDDIILIIVIAVLLLNECDDKLLLMALAYIFLADFFG